MLELKVILLVWLAFAAGYLTCAFMVGATKRETPRPDTVNVRHSIRGIKR